MMAPGRDPCDFLGSGRGPASPGPIVSPRADAGDPVAKLSSSLQMFRRRVNGALRRSDSQQAVKSPPLLVSGTLQPWLGGHQNPLSPDEPLSPWQGCGALLPEPWEGKEHWMNSVSQTPWGWRGAGGRRGGCCVP